MTADEARELSHGSMNHKGLVFKFRLAWICGRINKAIEKQAEMGECSTYYCGCNKKTAKQYFPIIANLYEDLGYFVAYNDARFEDTNYIKISWEDFLKLPLFKLEEYLNESAHSYSFTYHTKDFEKYLIKCRNDQDF